MKKQFFLLTGFLMLLASSGNADVLLLDTIAEEPPNSAEGIPRPVRGMTMTQVRKVFGEPQIEHPWVGDPPITRWDYGKFSVYFENEYVLDTVIAREPVMTSSKQDSDN